MKWILSVEDVLVALIPSVHSNFQYFTVNILNAKLYEGESDENLESEP